MRRLPPWFIPVKAALLMNLVALLLVLGIAYCFPIVAVRDATYLALTDWPAQIMLPLFVLEVAWSVWWTAGRRDLDLDLAATGVAGVVARCRLVAGAPDPGHPAGLPLVLLQNHRAYPRVRLLQVRNGTPDANGHYAASLIEVPLSETDPVAAVARTYGVDVGIYRQLAQRV
jgi:hypothetical protein